MNVKPLAGQKPLMEITPEWKKQWAGMPEFTQEDQSPWKTLKVHFYHEDALKAFSELVGQPLHKSTRSIWYPKAKIGRIADKRYRSTEPIQPQYPIYIISKGRWKSRLTAKSLEHIKVPYHIVIEPQEFKQYAKVIDKKKILVLPFSNLGQGSIPARNWVWEHAIKSGAKRHWILDDNIDGFYRLNKNLKVPVETGATFRAAEDFTDRFDNVAMSGFNYFMFASRKTKIKPYTLNTRIYSCILLKNDIDFRWRGRYNEDTDLSIRILKAGWCTILFNAFLAMKSTTMTMKGGNTDELYKGDGRLQMAQSLKDQHPTIVKITRKWGRYQHHVNYKIFRRNKLRLKPGVNPAEIKDKYGLYLQVLSKPERINK